VADIYDRMPVILAQDDYARWLGDEPDPRHLTRPFPADLVRMWPISTRVNKPENDVKLIQLATDAAERWRLDSGTQPPPESDIEIQLCTTRPSPWRPRRRSE
jgi:putative SOS response-associated peptidase YedK